MEVASRIVVLNRGRKVADIATAADRQRPAGRLDHRRPPVDVRAERVTRTTERCAPAHVRRSELDRRRTTARRCGRLAGAVWWLPDGASTPGGVPDRHRRRLRHRPRRLRPAVLRARSRSSTGPGARPAPGCRCGPTPGESDWSEPVARRQRAAGPSPTGRPPGSASTSRTGRAKGAAPGVLAAHRRSTCRPAGETRLYVTALGLYEVFLNGARVGDDELTPGYTQYRAPGAVPVLRRHRPAPPGPQRPGRPARRRLVPRPGRACPGPPTSSAPTLALRLQLEVRDGDGWTSSAAPTRTGGPPPSHVTAADLIGGQREDRRLRRRRPARRRRSTTASWAPAVTRDVRRGDRAVDRPARSAGSRSSRPVAVRPRVDGRRVRRRPRPEHQRLGPAHRPRPGRHPAHPARTASGSTPTAT